MASGRIVGGRDAQVGDAPYQCSIQESKIHSCGCSIISDKWTLTASHCVIRRNANALEILVGTNDLSNGGTYYKVERYVTHEEYRWFANDIAVIRVQGKIEFNNHVQPISISPAFNDIKDGDELILTGWGNLKVKFFFSYKFFRLKQLLFCENSIFFCRCGDDIQSISKSSN